VICADNPSSLSFLTLNQVSAALHTYFRIPGITGPAVWAVDIRASPRSPLFFFLGNDLLAVCLFKFNIFGLGCPALITEPVWTGINTPAVRAGPLQFDLPQFLSRHKQPSSSSFSLFYQPGKFTGCRFVSSKKVMPGFSSIFYPGKFLTWRR
jgi:hypothetical protein